MKIRAFLQHHLNPLHIYCRLCDLGMGEGRARKWAGKWERLLKFIK